LAVLDSVFNTLPPFALAALAGIAFVAAMARGFSGFGGALIFIPVASVALKLGAALRVSS